MFVDGMISNHGLGEHEKADFVFFILGLNRYFGGTMKKLYQLSYSQTLQYNSISCPLVVIAVRETHFLLSIYLRISI